MPQKRLLGAAFALFGGEHALRAFLFRRRGARLVIAGRGVIGRGGVFARARKRGKQIEQSEFCLLYTSIFNVLRGRACTV